MSDSMLTVAVVGHTNTGKTSLMRTLMRDAGFGEVSIHPATTRHVEGAAVLANGRKVMALYDTPGLEDSIGLLEHLDGLAGGRRADGIELVIQFLDSPKAESDFAQEAKALRQVLVSDVALYVIDARDRVLGKHRDELEILGRCATPIVPVLNFTAFDDAKVSLWREHLSRVNMHAVAEFDTVVFDEVCEQRLYEKMRTLLDAHEATLNTLIEDRRRQRIAVIKASADLVSDLLIDAAAYAMFVPMGDAGQAEAALKRLRNDVCAREQRCVDQLLELHRFSSDDCESKAIPIEDGKWGLDLFAPEALKQFGIKVGGGAATGAAIGFVLEMMTAGASLGALTAIGAAVGGVIGAGRSHGRRLMRRAQGETELRIDDATLRLLGTRQIMLTRALLRRGHAAQQPVSMDQPRRLNLPSVSAPKLPVTLQQARNQPAWSRIAGVDSSGYRPLAPARQDAVSALAKHVGEIIQRPADAAIQFP